MNEYYKIKDYCRNGLVQHLEQVLNDRPKFNNPDILDIGCGSGVPTLWLAENFSGNITAIDIDSRAIDYLQQKINDRKLQNKIQTICQTFDEFKYQDNHYDIILAEGFLNVIGFEKGFELLIEKVKNGGYFIIHDEYKDNESKIELIHKNNCKIVKSLILGETIWWRDFYSQLEIEINKPDNHRLRDLFINELKEIEQYKKNPSLFKSIYYLILK